MPQPEFRADDFVNPEAPEDERRLRPDHPRVRDHSYECSRTTQEVDLWKASLVSTVMDPWDAYPDGGDVPEDAVPGPSLTLFVKERGRGPGYVADFLYEAADLPVTVHGILANEGAGLGLIELELWRPGWGYWDSFGDFVGPSEENAALPVSAPITSDVLRRIPVGLIVARAQAELADQSWKEEAITVFGRPRTAGPELAAASLQALENANALAQPAQRGRPPLEEKLLHRVARAYLREAANGPGLHRRLADHFDRPEPTIKDWIKAARVRGYLSPAVPGRRAAGPGPLLGRPESGPGVPSA
ncbi:hypothetical protein EES41_36580 [Streptomyces sp. ADI95-16]|uniref:hypothetical protein n=1 Tax=Streptomyces sp. ADI95-16 TaxID=1522758 RepID=UPI000F432BD5|nr:hypothetical protein [Streptomyces sp. ADI95-16]AYV32277.1 hypothetical protein EES41_36580 [Streptomyces sp. ADI95-16]